MPVLVVEDKVHGNQTFATFNEGLGKVLRYGAFAPEVLERLKYVDPKIEVIMMTAFETTETMRQALRLRASDYINKPFDLSTVRSARVSE